MMDVQEKPTPPRVLQCKEIWGGIQPCDQTFDVPGLRGRILARPWKSDEGGQPLGEAGLLNLASRLDPSDPDALAPRLHGEVVDFQGGRDLADDVTVLALHHTGRDPEFTYDDEGNARPYDPDELGLS